MVETLIRELTDGGLTLWVDETNRIRGKMRDGGRIPYDLRLKGEALRDLGMPAVEAVRHHSGLVGEIVTLTGIPFDEALEIGEAIQRGEAALVGKVTLHTRSKTADLSFVWLDASTGQGAP